MKNHKLLIGIVAGLLVAVGAYMYFSQSSTAKPVTSTIASSNTGTNPVGLGNTAASASSFAGSDIATMLKNISQIKLNTGILQNPSFLALVDTTLVLPQTSVSGRVNPFGRSGALESATPVSTI
jgi:predicted ribosomally synthesized peptide with SipW-like signal peptide